ncbi:CCA tRNA nucleotidyltransferase [Sulfurimonas lithotrophica]|uniref:CCA tRNA nucleotidyltransferase n=1 Tax=Sulfurimonas lithotrophica TaxID=2590022 RepID=A0A5P8P3Y5_9BACT|nr:CCA tRNA nucleotidyltransferase [Sulfurimonas lithotrophica]QFR50385.1 CCA tRNA nucleotidyltransferase [Sulfurimonas lithotrophica]
MKNNIIIDYPNILNKIFDKLYKYDIKPIIVGGYIRDYIFNSASNKKQVLTKDIDIELYNATSIENIQQILIEFGNSNIIGKNFGVIKLKIDDLDIDFSMPRTENKISSGHTGFSVQTYSNLNFKTASLRRDFTINSIGYDIFSKKLLDPYNGLEDISNKILKIVNEKTFIEDPLRVLRAMQFCARFNLTADKQLIDICSKMCQKNLLNELPRERIFEEFKKLFLKAKRPSIGLNFLKEVDAFIYFNELNISKKDWNDTLKYIDNLDKTNLDNNTNIIIMLALLCYKMQRINRESFINKLTNKKNILNILETFYHVDIFLENPRKNLLKYNVLKDINLNMLLPYLRAKNISELTINKIKKIKPIIQGHNLLDIGMKESKEFGSILQLIYEVQIKKLFI